MSQHDEAARQIAESITLDLDKKRPAKRATKGEGEADVVVLCVTKHEAMTIQACLEVERDFIADGAGAFVPGLTEAEAEAAVASALEAISGAKAAVWTKPEDLLG